MSRALALMLHHWDFSVCCDRRSRYISDPSCPFLPCAGALAALRPSARCSLLKDFGAALPWLPFAMPPRAPRASLLPDPRAFLLVVCVLVLCAALCLPAPASGSSLLLGSSGFVLSRPLLLQGADVGAVLSALQADVAELKLQNAQLQGDLAVAKQQITELQGSVVELQDTVTTQGGRLSQAEAGIDTLEAAQSVMNGTLAEHGTRLVIAESNVAGLDA